jgi:hypothetical protein
MAHFAPSLLCTLLLLRSRRGRWRSKRGAKERVGFGPILLQKSVAVAAKAGRDRRHNTAASDNAKNNNCRALPILL